MVPPQNQKCIISYIVDCYWILYKTVDIMTTVVSSDWSIR
jgi:hypothetical protein